MRYLLKKSTILLLTILLSACGGGGGSGSGSGAAGGGSTGTTSTPDPAKQVSIGFGTVDTTKITGLPNVALSSSRQSSTLSALDVTASPNDLIMVRSGSVPILMAFTFAGESGLTVDYASTAVALVLMQPSLLGATVDTQKLLIPLIKASPNFQPLVDLITARVNNSTVDPLNTFVYPDVANLASLIIDGLPQQTPLVAKILAKRVFAATTKNGFSAAFDSSNSDILSITNPNTVYYDVTINNHTKLLEPKDGVVNLNYAFFPPETNLISDKTTSFSFINDYLKTADSKPFEINLTCKFSLNPLGGSGGAATWRNIIKGFAIAFESVGITLDYTNSAKFDSFVKRYESAFTSLNNKFSVMKQNIDSTYYYARKVKALTHVMNIVIDNLPLPADGSFTNEDKSNVIKTMSALNDLIADVTALAGNPSEQEIQTAIDMFADTTSKSPSIHELIRKVRDGRMKSTSVWSTVKRLTETMVSDTYMVNMAKPVPDGSDVKAQLIKISAAIKLLSAESSITGDAPIVGLFKEFANPANGITDDHVKALFSIISQNAFVGTNKTLTVGNKMVPFAYDVASCFSDDSSSASILVSAGKASLISKPIIKDFRITNYDTGEVIYDVKNGKISPVSIPKGTKLDVFADISVPNTLTYVIDKLGLNPLSSNQIQVYKAEVIYNSSATASSKIIDRISAAKPLLSSNIQWNYYTSDFGFVTSSPFNIGTFAQDQYIFARSGIDVTEDVANLRFRFTNAAGQYETVVVPNKANVPPVVTLRATRSLADPSKYDYVITATDDKDPTLKLNVAWNFGDAATQIGGFTTTHQYAATQGYTATVTVTDSDGASTVVTAEANPTVSKTNFVDVVFLVDLTGSYDDDIATFKAQAKEIVVGISGLGNNVQIGVASFRDFAVGDYGGSGDYPYKLEQQLTYLTEYISPALAPLTASGGSDLPESDLEALYQLATTDIGWVGSSKKVVLLATDASFHNSDTDPSYPGHGYTATLAALKARGIVVYGLLSGTNSDAIADLDKIAADTGGKVFPLTGDSAGVVDAIKGISTAKAVGKRLNVPNSYVVGSKKQGQSNR